MGTLRFVFAMDIPLIRFPPPRRGAGGDGSAPLLDATDTDPCGQEEKREHHGAERQREQVEVEDQDREENNVLFGGRREDAPRRVKGRQGASYVSGGVDGEEAERQQESQAMGRRSVPTAAHEDEDQKQRAVRRGLRVFCLAAVGVAVSVAVVIVVFSLLLTNASWPVRPS